MGGQTRWSRGTCMVFFAMAVSLAGISHGQALPPPPMVDAFGRVPAVTDVDINPGGTRLAWIDHSGKLARIVIFDLASHREARGLNLPPETTPRSVIWADDETVLASVTVTHSSTGNARNQKEWQRWFAIDAKGGSPRMLLAQGGGVLEWVTGASLIRRSTDKPRTVIMASWDWSATKGRREIGSRLHQGRKDSSITYNLYAVDVDSGDGDVLERGTPFTSDWILDAPGKVLIRSEWDLTREKFGIYAKVGSGWRPLYEAGRCGRLWGLTLNAENTAVLAAGSLCGEERVKLWSLPLDGSAMKAVVEDPVLDVEDLITDPLDGIVRAAILAGDNNIRWLDPRSEQRRKGLRRSFGADRVSIYGRTADDQKIVVLAEGISQPPVFHVVDYAAKRADIINEAYPALVGAKLGNVRSFQYEARDKYPLIAYLTVPAGREEKDLPLVVLPHGGPESRDVPEFDWWSQFLASRGYAVVQPQFRGSSGFGQAHADAGRHQWGLRMQDDVSDAVYALISQGIVDSKRICIVGASYGGYAALAGAAFTPNLYACAVSVAGVSDLPLMIGHVDRMMNTEKESESLDYWREHIGLVTDPQVIAKSPARAAKAIRAPVLLIHGSEDTVVPTEQSRVMALALKQAGKPHELIELEGEDHWMSRSETRIRMLTELERFLSKHLGPAGGPN